ncbi:MAG: maleylpyruvate isomerase family mycothiol-dependent enzyme, partial [Ilumatobacter sp.]
MSEIAQRFRCVATDFTAVVDVVGDEAWSNPSPCEGWTARDVVGHLVEWIPAPGFLLGTFGIDTAPAPSVADHPAAAWAVVRDAIQSGLDDPATALRSADCGPLGHQSFEDAVAMTVISDVFVHTWDLAQAAGVDVALDADELRRQHDTIAQ